MARASPSPAFPWGDPSAGFTAVGADGTGQQAGALPLRWREGVVHFHWVFAGSETLPEAGCSALLLEVGTTLC
jgi:hypothetical protein